MKNKRMPKEIEENFIFDCITPFNKNKIALVRYKNWCGELNTDGILVSKYKCGSLNCCETFNYIWVAGKAGVIDKNGNFIIPLLYDEVELFKENLWRVSINKKYGLIDNNCEKIWYIKYDDISCIKDDVFLVSLNGKYGIIDIYEKEIIPIKYDFLGRIYEKDGSFYAKLDGKMGIINLDNEVFLPFEYEYVTYLESNIAVQKNNKFIIINEAKQQICKTVFENFDENCCFGKNPILYPAMLNDKWGFVDEFGNTKIEFKYADISNEETGNFASVSMNKDKSGNTYGLIDKNGNLILPFEYQCYGFTCIDDNRFATAKDDKFGIVDRNNKIIANFIFDDIFPTYVSEDNAKYYGAEIDDKWGFIDGNGKPLKINKNSLKIPETKLNAKNVTSSKQTRLPFS